MIRQRLKQHAVYDTENGRVGTNSNCECEQGDSGETGTLSEHPRTEANVFAQVLNPIHSPLLTARLLDGLYPSKLSERCKPRLLGAHSRLDVLLRLHLDVRTHLVIHLPFELLLLKQRPKPILNLSQPAHG